MYNIFIKLSLMLIVIGLSGCVTRIDTFYPLYSERVIVYPTIYERPVYYYSCPVYPVYVVPNYHGHSNNQHYHHKR